MSAHKDTIVSINNVVSHLIDNSVQREVRRVDPDTENFASQQVTTVGAVEGPAYLVYLRSLLSEKNDDTM